MNKYMMFRKHRKSMSADIRVHNISTLLYSGIFNLMLSKTQ